MLLMYDARSHVHLRDFLASHGKRGAVAGLEATSVGADMYRAGKFGPKTGITGVFH